MRIAIFSDNFYPELSGISDSLVTTARELEKRGHGVAFFVPRYSKRDYAVLGLPQEGPFPGESIPIIRFCSFPYPTGNGQGRLVIPLGFRVLLVKKFDPDLIHVHLPYGVGLEGLFASLSLRLPLVGTNHTPTAEFMHYSPFGGGQARRSFTRYVTWFYNRCQLVSAPSRTIFEEMNPFGFRAPHRVIPNPLDLSVFHPVQEKEHLKKKFGFPGFTLLTVGRLASEKNIDVTLQSIALIQDRIPGLVFGIIGKGPVEGELRKVARSLKIEKQVKFFGFVEQPVLAQIYNAGDVFVMMSTAETQSLAMMQGMLSELPVIAAQAWGLPEYVSRNNGFLVPPGDADTLAQRILSLYRDSELRAEMGRNGRIFAQQFSPSHIAHRWEEDYRAVLEKHHRRDP